jgi:hypothetical protein
MIIPSELLGELKSKLIQDKIASRDYPSPAPTVYMCNVFAFCPLNVSLYQLPRAYWVSRVAMRLYSTAELQAQTTHKRW